MAFPFSELVFGSVTLLLNLFNDKYIEMDKAQSDFPSYNSYSLPNVQEFDFIVVGGGTAGCLVANRLSEKFSVLLLEQGGNPLPQTYVPGNWGYVFKNLNALYKWDSVKQNDSCLETDGICEIKYGKALGGTTTVNGMIYNRGHPSDYDRWGSIVKDESWNYENLVPFFKMHENFIGETSDHLGYNGELNITKKETVLNEQEMVWKETWAKAGVELGYENFENSNMPQKMAFGPISQTLKDGVRVNAYDSFIKPIEYRESLTISRYSKATKIDIDESGKAVGVLYERHGINQYARAKNEIIVCAGVMQSPWLLMNSGIGPEDQLNEAQIPVRANLPVGQYWQDHPITIIKVKIDGTIYENVDEKEIENYINNQKGPIANLLGLNSQAFIVTETAKTAGHDNSWPDVQLIFHYLSKNIFQEEDDTMRVLVSLGLVQSYGTLTLNTTHPNEVLVWNPNYFADERDFNAIVDGLELCVKIFETEAFKALGAKLEPQIPGCENFDVRSRDYWACFAKIKSSSHWHAVGSVRMGAEDDPKAVLDTKLRVKGISGLRVMDNSIQPAVPNGNTQAAAYTIGEKGTKMIFEEYSK